MKTIKKLFLLTIVALMGMFALTSCNEQYDFYNDWYSAGAVELANNNPFETISMDDLLAKKANGDKFVLVMGLSKSATQMTEMNMFAKQANYLNYDSNESGKLYYYNVSSEYQSYSARNKLKENLGIKKAIASPSDSLVVVLFNDNRVLLDTSDTESDALKDFKYEDVFKLESLLSYIYNDFQGNN